MRAERFEEGEKVEVNHQRKGKFGGWVVACNEEWLTVRLHVPVEGLSRDWDEGDLLMAKWSLCDSVVKV